MNKQYIHNGTIIGGTLDLSGSLKLSGISQSSTPHILTYDTASGQIYYTASSAIGGGGSGTAAGSDTQIQFNSGSSFSGSAEFRFIYTSRSLEQGQNVDAIGQYSHAQGLNVVTYGENSHAEGWNGQSGYDGLYSASFTAGTATFESIHGNVTSSFLANKYIFTSLKTNGYTQVARIISSSFNGTFTIVWTSDSSISGQRYVMQENLSGDRGIYPGAGVYAHSEGNSTVTLGRSSHAEGSSAYAFAEASHAEGANTYTLGDYSHAEGESTYAIGQSSHAEGFSSIAYGYASHAEGYFTIASGSYSHTAGRQTLASGDYQTIVGQFNRGITNPSAFIIGNGIGSANRSNLLFASGSQVQISGSLIVSGSEIISGTLNVTQGITGSLLGTASFATSASWAPNVVTNPGGSDTQIQFNSGSAFAGSSALRYEYATQSLELGTFTTASGIWSFAHGGFDNLYYSTYPQAIGRASHAEGMGGQAWGSGSHTEGIGSIVWGAMGGHAEGAATWVGTPNAYSASFINGTGSIQSIEGDKTTQLGALNGFGGYLWFCTKDGFDTYTRRIVTASFNGTFTTVIVTPTIANRDYFIGNADFNLYGWGGTQKAAPQAAHGEGISSIALGWASHAEGEGWSIGASSHAEGFGTAIGILSHAEGFQAKAIGDYSHAEGYQSVASGSYSHAEASGIAYGEKSHAEGDAVAEGQYSHAEGDGIAMGDYSHAEGAGTALGMFSHAEGSSTATGDYSHAEGEATQAIGDYSHAEGNGTTASGSNSHAEGNSTTASGSNSHAEGDGTEARGEYSHTEGAGTIAIGDGSHAEGLYTETYGRWSHAAGRKTRTDADFQTVVGIANATSSIENAFIIGNGTVDPMDGFVTNASNLLIAHGSQVEITGSLYVTDSVNITNVLNLAKSHPLPTATTGSLAVSGSSLYFHNGTSWRQVSLL